MKTTTHERFTVTEALRIANEFNRRHGGNVLHVKADEAPVVTNEFVQNLAYAANDGFGWRAASEVFALAYPDVEPTHGQLIRLGRQLGGLFISRKLGARRFYWVAPPDAAPTAW